MEAVFTLGSSKTGLIQALNKAARARRKMVMMELTATATEEIASPAGVLGSFFASFSLKPPIYLPEYKSSGY